MSEKKIQRYEISGYFDKVYCPFCGSLVRHEDEETQEVLYDWCPHTIFACYDDFFEGVSEAFEKSVGDVDFSEISVDEYTDLCGLPNCIKFAAYQPAPSFFGEYIGFSLEPIVEDS